ncbi:hypothetical protein [Chloroherpeton thalassium]|uniref:hypothetical protein n=1 Tax=Chloroherpeton thalassium TaxID=100716 RepID=UPI0012F9331A|nr:hypothetical protein [Chloroherpeton thalassium]
MKQLHLLLWVVLFLFGFKNLKRKTQRSFKPQTRKGQPIVIHLAVALLVEHIGDSFTKTSLLFRFSQAIKLLLTWEQKMIIQFIWTSRWRKPKPMAAMNPMKMALPPL